MGDYVGWNGASRILHHDSVGSDISRMLEKVRLWSEARDSSSIKHLPLLRIALCGLVCPKRKRVSYKAAWVENMTTGIGYFVSIIFVGEHHLSGI